MGSRSWNPSDATTKPEIAQLKKNQCTRLFKWIALFFWHEKPYMLLASAFSVSDLCLLLWTFWILTFTWIFWFWLCLFIELFPLPYGLSEIMSSWAHSHGQLWHVNIFLLLPKYLKYWLKHLKALWTNMSKHQNWVGASHPHFKIEIL